MAAADDAGTGAAAPGVLRRLACFVYEGVLLFGVLMFAGLAYAGLTQQRHALHGKAGLQALLFVVLGLYFIGFWSRGGQTLAMKAWHIRLVDVSGQAVTQTRAMARYLLAYLWFVPALAALYLGGMTSTGAAFGLLSVGVLAYAGLAFLRADRQFWHDTVCGTRLVHWRVPAKDALAPSAPSA